MRKTAAAIVLVALAGTVSAQLLRAKPAGDLPRATPTPFVVATPGAPVPSIRIGEPVPHPFPTPRPSTCTDRVFQKASDLIGPEVEPTPEPYVCDSTPSVCERGARAKAKADLAAVDSSFQVRLEALAVEVRACRH